MKNKILALAMENSIISIKKESLAWTVALTTLIIIAPSILAHTPGNQMVTGSIVNGLLFVAAIKMPLANAIFIAILPSSIALMRGLLPAPMAFLVPFIIVSNIALILSFRTFKKFPFMGILVASLTKFGFLYSVTLIVANKISPNLAMMFQWPQLITALIGGFLAINIFKFFENTNLNND